MSCTAELGKAGACCRLQQEALRSDCQIWIGVRVLPLIFLSWCMSHACTAMSALHFLLTITRSHHNR